MTIPNIAPEDLGAMKATEDELEEKLLALLPKERTPEAMAPAIVALIEVLAEYLVVGATLEDGRHPIVTAMHLSSGVDMVRSRLSHASTRRLQQRFDAQYEAKGATKQ